MEASNLPWKDVIGQETEVETFLHENGLGWLGTGARPKTFQEQSKKKKKNKTEKKSDKPKSDEKSAQVAAKLLDLSPSLCDLALLAQ